MSITIKDVHNAVRDVKMQGGHEGDIEAFLINSDDLHELIKQREQTPHGAVFNEIHDPDGFKILGIKIIQSPYSERGTIFKIMKNDQKQYAHPTYSPTVPGSGMIPGWKNFGTTVGEASGAVKELVKEMSIPKHLLDEAGEKTETTEVEPKEDKVVEDRHSETRKIKLD